MNLSRDPAEAALFVGVGVVNPGHLTRRREEALLDEHVVFGEKDTETGMGVVPADNSIFRVELVLHAIDRLPGILSEGDVSARLGRVQGFNGVANLDNAICVFADQTTPDLSLPLP